MYYSHVHSPPPLHKEQYAILLDLLTHTLMRGAGLLAALAALALGLGTAQAFYEGGDVAMLTSSSELKTILRKGPALVELFAPVSDREACQALLAACLSAGVDRLPRTCGRLEGGPEGTAEMATAAGGRQRQRGLPAALRTKASSSGLVGSA